MELCLIMSEILEEDACCLKCRYYSYQWGCQAESYQFFEEIKEGEE